MRALLTGAALVAALTSTSYADDAFRCPGPGTVLTYSSGGRVTFGKQDGFTCVATDPRGDPVRIFLGLVGIPEFISSHGEKLYPFHVGNQIEFNRKADNRTTVGSAVTNTTSVGFRDVIKVVRQERVTTKAGAFNAFVIERREDWLLAKNSPSWVYTYWWAAELGYAVKEVDELNGRVVNQVEVTEWKQP
jgi:hypothetical protein